MPTERSAQPDEFEPLSAAGAVYSICFRAANTEHVFALNMLTF
jgi:hypothetical protein